MEMLLVIIQYQKYSITIPFAYGTHEDQNQDQDNFPCRSYGSERELVT
jgi:hypothetical protein